MPFISHALSASNLQINRNAVPKKPVMQQGGKKDEYCNPRCSTQRRFDISQVYIYILYIVQKKSVFSCNAAGIIRNQCNHKSISAKKLIVVLNETTALIKSHGDFAAFADDDDDFVNTQINREKKESNAKRKSQC